MVFLEILWFILLSIGIVLAIIGLIWLILPYAFRFFVAPHFDGCYKYNKNDFQENGKTPIRNEISDQENNFIFEFDKNIPEYQIIFGENRKLSGGKIKIHYNGSWYSTNPEKNEKKILFRAELETSDISTEFLGLKGICNRITIEWTLELTGIRLISHFGLFKNCQLKTKEPDLKYKSGMKNGINFIVFSLEFPDGLENCTTGQFSKPIFKFPCFQNESDNKRIFSYKNEIFSPPAREVSHTNAPVIFFDDNLNTILITALDNFMINLITIENSNFKIACGLDGEIESLEKNYRNEFILHFGKGINNSMETLSYLLRAFHFKEKKSMYMDQVVSYLGYWTDNGAYYYYNPIRNKKMSETIIEVDKYARELEIPIKYYNLDSWWYLKDVAKWKRTMLGGLGRIFGGGSYGGTVAWEMDPNTMHVDVPELSQLLEKPFNCHNRWFSYDNKYKKDGNFEFYDENKKSICIEIDFWDKIMDNCEKWNIINYEQDWMHNQFQSFKILRDSTRNAEKWLTSMAEAAKEHGRTVQFCMSDPGMFLTAIKLDAVSLIRTNGDYHPRWPRIYDLRFFMQTNMLAIAAGIWPFKDVFRSTCEGLINGEKQPGLMALISTLSCGPVGVGDKIGKFGKDVIMKTCRKDGLILKPDKPITVADRMFLPNAKYFLSSTYSVNSGYKWHYVIINKLRLKVPKDTTITPEDLDIKEEKMVAYEYFKNKFQILDEQHPFDYVLKKQDYMYWIVAPLLRDDFAIIGDISKFTTMNFKEFLSIDSKDNDDNEFTIKIENIKEELVKLLIYDKSSIDSIEIDSQKIPKTEKELSDINSAVMIENVNPSKWFYDKDSNISLLIIKFEENSVKNIHIKLKSEKTQNSEA